MAPKSSNLAVAFVLCFALVWRMAAWKGKGTGLASLASGIPSSSSSVLAVNETLVTRELADVVHRVASAVSAASMIQRAVKLADESEDAESVTKEQAEVIKKEVKQAVTKEAEAVVKEEAKVIKAEVKQAVTKEVKKAETKEKEEKAETKEKEGSPEPMPEAQIVKKVVKDIEKQEEKMEKEVENEVGTPGLVAHEPVTHSQIKAEVEKVVEEEEKMIKMEEEVEKEVGMPGLMTKATTAKPSAAGHESAEEGASDNLLYLAIGGGIGLVGLGIVGGYFGYTRYTDERLGKQSSAGESEALDDIAWDENDAPWTDGAEEEAAEEAEGDLPKQ